jgi:hypothetical protein
MKHLLILIIALILVTGCIDNSVKVENTTVTTTQITEVPTEIPTVEPTAISTQQMIPIPITTQEPLLSGGLDKFKPSETPVYEIPTNEIPTTPTHYDRFKCLGGSYDACALEASPGYCKEFCQPAPKWKFD